MLSVDHSNIEGPPLAVKCVRKFGSALGGEVTSVCMYVCIRSYDTCRSFDPIFMKFTWLVRAPSWVNHFVFGNNLPSRTTYMGENMPPKPVFGV